MLRVTTLVEDSPGPDPSLVHEHGLSFLVESDGRSLLFDTGQSGAFLRNAGRLGIDLGEVEQVLISHGHYDHSGGVRRALEHLPAFDLTVGRGFFDKKYGVKEGELRFIGNDFDERELREAGIRYRELDEDIREVSPGVYAVTGFPRRHPEETVNPRFKVQRNGGLCEDDFSDELLLAVDTSGGVVVVLGCSHPGLRNMLDHTIELLQRPLRAVIGGTHLVEASEEALEQSVDYLQAAGLELAAVSHCTGERASRRLAAADLKYEGAVTGTVMSFR